jgi:hypothetical protein
MAANNLATGQICELKCWLMCSTFEVSLEAVVEKLEKELTKVKAALESKTKASEVRSASARIRELDALLEQRLVNQRDYDGQKAAIIASV